MCCTVIAAALGAAAIHHIYFDRTNLPNIESFVRFEFPTVGHIYDINNQPLVEFAAEYRRNTTYEDIPPIVRDAVLAAEDKNFFSHGGVDYSAIPRVLVNIKIGSLLARLPRLGRHDKVSTPALFPQGGSTITQQLVRNYFLRELTAQENSIQLGHGGLLPRVLSSVIGSRGVNRLYRKLEEIRLSLCDKYSERDPKN
jgi:penicillin-binding protein 1A